MVNATKRGLGVRAWGSAVEWAGKRHVYFYSSFCTAYIYFVWKCYLQQQQQQLLPDL